MDVMLQELDGKDTTNNNAVNVSYIQSNRGRGGGFPRGRSNYSFRPRNNRGRGAPPPQRFQNQGRRPNYSCHHCLEARRYDSSIIHPAQECPFPQLRRNNTRQPQSGPPFKVLLVPTTNPTQPAYVDQMENMSLNSHPAPTPHSQLPIFTPQDQYRDQYYQDATLCDEQYDPYYSDNQYYNSPAYDPGTIEDLPPHL